MLSEERKREKHQRQRHQYENGQSERATNTTRKSPSHGEYNRDERKDAVAEAEREEQGPNPREDGVEHFPP